VTALVNLQGTLLAQYTYDPYGNVTSMNGPLASVNKYRFSSKEAHDNSGLYYYGFRFYSPSLQRWVNLDPIDELGGYNLFTFVSNMAINALDAFGNFALNTDGTCFTNLHNFTGADDGSAPEGALVLSGNILYGTTSGQAFGINSGYGTVFSLTLPAPQLAIAVSGSNVILTWPTNMAGFDFTGYTLQCATSPVSTNWCAVTPPPVVVNGQQTVTNPISATQMFYRLTQ
jgi:RHS repeat-associated protein